VLSSSPETMSLSFPFLALFRFIYCAYRNYSSPSLASSSSEMVSIAGGAVTEDSAVPELIVSFGVQEGDLRDPSCVLYGQASSTQRIKKS
jgi:hypothetical protein